MSEELIGRYLDFIGLGAQRAGTSWIYSCLYEHPNIYLPVKEVHFFSRERNWSKGYEWYEAIFEKCPQDAKTGEFSTSYLSHPATPERIRERYTDVKLIACLRNPINRAYSNYLNDIMAGVVEPEVTFGEALKEHPGYIERGRYATHLKRYLQVFSIDQILLLIYEDSLKNPSSFITTIYEFIGVDPSFVPSMVDTVVNKGGVPRFVWLDRLLVKASGILRSKGLHNLWWLAKRAGLGDKIRALNTREIATKDRGPGLSEREMLCKMLESEIAGLEKLMGRNLEGWRK
jgi:hypothetical protein